jgi:hypothetical protein
MMWVLSGVTAAVLAVIGMFVARIAKAPAPSTAALSASSQTVRPSRATAPASARRTSSAASARTSPAPVPRISDASSGLSYRLLRSPWRRGCPAALSTQAFDWSAGENAVAGFLSGTGTNTAWYGNACSGVLTQQFSYTGPADLESAAASVTDALDVTYYSGLQHYRTLQASYPLWIGGHQAWEIRFAMTYPDAASLGLSWASEDGAVLVADRGAGRAPALFYVSVPNNLGTGNVSVLVDSLGLTG